MNATKFYEFCRSKDACEAGLKWIEGKSLAEFWQTCERADWMIWLVWNMAGEEGWPTIRDAHVALLGYEAEMNRYERGVWTSRGAALRRACTFVRNNIKVPLEAT
jgi:hypothetical protein